MIISGTIGDHGVAVMSKRENLEFETEILSDTAPLHGLVAAMVAAAGPGLRVMRDPTRGGLAATLNELAHQSGVGFSIEEDAIPVRPEVAAACEFLGLDPLNVANEGKLVAIVAPEFADRSLAAMRAHPLGARSLGHRPGGRGPPLFRGNAHRFRRGADRRLARRRATPPHLLTTRRAAARSRPVAAAYFFGSSFCGSSPGFSTAGVSAGAVSPLRARAPWEQSGVWP